jgi:hypothetical protein
MSLDRSAAGCLCSAFAVVQNPIIVDVGRQPDPTGDISIDFVVGMFALAGVLLAVAVLGCIIVAGVVIFIKRRRSALNDSNEMTSHTRLKI